MNDSKKYIKDDIVGITSCSYYTSGEIMDCKVDKYNELKVKDQTYIPRYSKPDERKKDTKAISFYASGAVKSIALEKICNLNTSIGKISAEMVTFYESGEFNSIFPLNGQLSFGWSIEDEEELLNEMQFEFSFGSFKTKLIGARFFESGALKSMILWPNKKISIETPLGKVPIRIGFRLYENGNINSFEPAYALPIETPIGTIMAFDQHAVGMDADFNSVRFYPDGRLQSLSTNSDIIVNDIITKKRESIYQQLRLDMTTDEMIKLPVIITFENDKVSFDNGAEKKSFVINDSKFLFLFDGYYSEKKCNPGSDCSGCAASCM